ncbi:uncharacterized protein METZ01_LOCUS71828, partial [marine metagenome]
VHKDGVNQLLNREYVDRNRFLPGSEWMRIDFQHL